MINRYYKILSAASILFFLAACSNKPTYDELTSDLPANTNVRTYSSSILKYVISLPKELKLIEKEYEDAFSLEVFVDSTIPFEEGSNLLSIAKYPSQEKTLKGAWKNLVSKRGKMKDFEIHSEGMTHFLSVPAYYEHCSYPISEKMTESISFLIKGKSSDVYTVSIQVNPDKKYPDNIKCLLSCVKTLKILP